MSKKTKEELSEAMSIGLGLWLFFLLVLLWLQYPTLVALLFSITGGICGSWLVVTFTQKKEIKPLPELELEKRRRIRPRKRHAPNLIEAQKQREKGSSLENFPLNLWPARRKKKLK